MSAKALKACADYARLNTEIKCLTRAIGDALNKCRGVQGKREYVISFATEEGRYVDAHEDVTHLKDAITPDTDDFGDAVFMSEESIRDYLLDSCPYCLTAWEHIQARKTARKQFGAVKRSIGAMGRAALRRGKA